MIAISCEFVELATRLDLLERNNIARNSLLAKAINDFTEVTDLIPVDNVTFTYNRFVGGGMCFDKATITCLEPVVEPEMVPPCLIDEEGGAMTAPRDVSRGKSSSPGDIQSQSGDDQDDEDGDDEPLDKMGGTPSDPKLNSDGNTTMVKSDGGSSSIPSLVIVIAASLFGAGLLGIF